MWITISRLRTAQKIQLTGYEERQDKLQSLNSEQLRRYSWRVMKRDKINYNFWTQDSSAQKIQLTGYEERQDKLQFLNWRQLRRYSWRGWRETRCIAISERLHRDASFSQNCYPRYSFIALVTHQVKTKDFFIAILYWGCGQCYHACVTRCSVYVLKK